MLGIPPFRIALLTNREATASAVLSRVRQILFEARREGPIGAVYVFFSGHGLAIEGAPHLLTYDYDEFAFERTTIAERDLVAWVKEHEPHSITLFVDACFSGRTRDGGSVIADAKGLLAGEGATAARDNDAALFSASTAVGLSMSLQGVGQGAFSYVLMRGLEGEADADSDGEITSAELQAWISAELPKLARTPSGPQLPGYHDVAPDRVLVRLE